MHWHNTSQSIMKLSYSEEGIKRAEGSTEMPLSAMCDSIKISVGPIIHPWKRFTNGQQRCSVMFQTRLHWTWQTRMQIGGSLVVRTIIGRTVVDCD